MMNNITIDPEFRAWLPNLSSEEKEGLEESLKREGCRDALLVWRDGARRVLVDGHNRFEICEANAIAYAVAEIRFDRRADALRWMIDNQLGKRNLTAEMRSYLIGKKYNLIKMERGGSRKQTASAEKAINTKEKVAKEFKASPATVNRASKFAKAVDTIKDRIGEEEAAKILSHDSKIKQKDVPALAEAAKKRPDEVKAAIAGDMPVSRIIKKEKKVKAPRVNPTMPKGRQVSQQELRRLIRDIGACALTSTDKCSDTTADTIIGQEIQRSNTRIVAQAIAILVEEWPGDGIAFFKGAVTYLKALSKRGGKGRPDPNKELIERMIAEQQGGVYAAR